MAPKKASPLDDTDFGAGDAELDQAIDDLRGVLKKDSASDFGAEFGGDIGGGEADLSAFGGDAATVTASAATLVAAPTSVAAVILAAAISADRISRPPAVSTTQAPSGR